MLRNLLKDSLRINGCQRSGLQCSFEMCPHLNKKFWYKQDLSWPFLGLVVNQSPKHNKWQKTSAIPTIVTDKFHFGLFTRVFCYNICNLYLSFVHGKCWFLRAFEASLVRVVKSGQLPAKITIYFIMSAGYSAGLCFQFFRNRLQNQRPTMTDVKPPAWKLCDNPVRLQNI